MLITPYKHEDKDEIIELWHRCGLVAIWNNPESDIGRKMKVQSELFLVGLHT